MTTWDFSLESGGLKCDGQLLVWNDEVAVSIETAAVQTTDGKKHLKQVENAICPKKPRRKFLFFSGRRAKDSLSFSIFSLLPGHILADENVELGSVVCVESVGNHLVLGGPAAARPSSSAEQWKKGTRSQIRRKMKISCQVVARTNE
jgi:hypothetical protein